MSDKMGPEPVKLPNVNTYGNGRNGKISMVVGVALLSIIVSLGAGYLSSRLAISKDLGNRPIREEVERKIDKVQQLVKDYTDAQQKAVMRELTTLQSNVQALQSTLNQVLIQLKTRQ